MPAAVAVAGALDDDGDDVARGSVGSGASYPGSADKARTNEDGQHQPNTTHVTETVMSGAGATAARTFFARLPIP